MKIIFSTLISTVLLATTLLAQTASDARMTDQSCRPVFDLLSTFLDFGNFPKSRKVDASGRCVMEHGLSSSKSVISFAGVGLGKAAKSNWLPKSLQLSANLAETVQIKSPVELPRKDEPLSVKITARRENRSLNVDEARVAFGDTLLQLEFEATGLSLASKSDAEGTILSTELKVFSFVWSGARGDLEMPFKVRDVEETKAVILKIVKYAPFTSMSGETRAAIKSFIESGAETKARFNLQLSDGSLLKIGQMMLGIQRLGAKDADETEIKEAVALAIGEAVLTADWDAM